MESPLTKTVVSTILTKEELESLHSALSEENAKFSEIIMTLIERYQVLNSDDLTLLCDRRKSREYFKSDYAYFKEIDTNNDLLSQLKGNDGRTRYYQKTYVFHDKVYVMTSQLYGLKENATHRDNRKPFHMWVLGKFGIYGEDLNALNDAIQIKESFRKWFATQPQKNNSSSLYSDSTIDAAVRLLESGISKLGLSKYSDLNCFDITDYSEFRVVRDECYEAAEKFDKSQFHGDFRNGLDFYLLYLKELAHFKELLEIFVRQLKINNDIVPGEKVYGQGYKDMPKIQSIYNHCREYEGYILEMTLQAGYNSHNASNYIHMRDTWINIVPTFTETQDGNYDVTDLQVVIKPDNKVTSNYPTESVEKLGLFDGHAPNESLITFFADFKAEIDKYSNSKIGTFDSWEIIDEVTAIKTCDKSFFEYNGSGVPKGICWFFGAEELETSENKAFSLVYNGVEYDAKVQNDSTDRRRVRIFWSAELGKLFNVYKDNSVKAKFVKVSEAVYEITIIGGEKEMTVKEQVNAIKTYIANKGFNYEGNLIENFYLSLLAKPFVILAGTSGTGKTRLVRLFAEAISAEYKLVSVRPDWSDSSDLFGHVDLNQRFIKGDIIDFVKNAELNPTKPYIICLDEMNLARVEYYMSDILSTIETRRFENGQIITDAVIPASIYGNDTMAAGKYGKVILPGNLYIVGTVNMDETTFPFSKKVLDRANTIEFSFVNLMSMPSFKKDTVQAQNLPNTFLMSKYITLNDCKGDDKTYIEGVCLKLKSINDILETAHAHIGYRVRDEIVFYMLNNKKAELLDEKAAFDNQVMQKILPRVQGSSESVKTMLGELLKICETEKYVSSAKKIEFMIKRYDEDGFTSYWL